jgi:F0F1-type ATP synthase assembly protein I
VKDDRALLLLSASLVIFVLSLLLPVFPVHSYCENRTGAAIFGVISITISLALFRNRARSIARKIASGVGQALSIFATAVNLVFILYATHECRHMFDSLH